MHTRGVFLFVVAVLLTACAPESLGYTFEDLPPGDVTHGAALFITTCSDCHSLDGSQTAGPSLMNYGSTAGTRIKDQSPEEYTFNSILRPSRYVVQGYSNVMPSNYNDLLSRQETADLIAYLLSLQGEN